SVSRHSRPSAPATSALSSAGEGGSSPGHTSSSCPAAARRSSAGNGRRRVTAMRAMSNVRPMMRNDGADRVGHGEASLGDAQSSNPPDDPDMIFPDASQLDADVDYEGDGP